MRRVPVDSSKLSVFSRCQREFYVPKFLNGWRSNWRNKSISCQLRHRNNAVVSSTQLPYCRLSEKKRIVLIRQQSWEGGDAIRLVLDKRAVNSRPSRRPYTSSGTGEGHDRCLSNPVGPAMTTWTSSSGALVTGLNAPCSV